MSYDFSAIAVRAPLERVHGALSSWLAAKGVELEASNDGSAPDLNVQFAAGWSVLFFRRRLLPNLMLELSASLSARAIAIDQCEVVSYQHFSLVEVGQPKMLFTSMQFETLERMGVDREAFAACAKERSLRKRPKGFRYETDFEDSDLFVVFNDHVADIDLETAALDASEQGDAYRFEGDDRLAPTRMDPSAGVWWNGLARGVDTVR
jgi:hypothetical protein